MPLTARRRLSLMLQNRESKNIADAGRNIKTIARILKAWVESVGTLLMDLLILAGVSAGAIAEVGSFTL
jgi:hypothetical protein